MATPTNAQLGTLLASYFSTSNDALAINFRKHYSPTLTPTSRRKTKAKHFASHITEATFIYRYRNKFPNAIPNLYQCLLKAKWIAADTKPDAFCVSLKVSHLLLVSNGLANRHISFILSVKWLSAK